MVWTDEVRLKLVNCTTDAELREAFPGVKLSNLKRRRREYRAPQAQAEVSDQQSLRGLHQLITSAGIAIEDIGRVEKVRVSNYEMLRRGENGETAVTPMRASQIVLTPSWADGPKWPLVQPASPTVVRPSKPRPVRIGMQTALILPDPQVGFRRDLLDGTLDPFHDEGSLSISLQMAATTRPDLIVLLGDLLDLAEFGSYEQEPGFVRTTQAQLNRAHLYLAQLRACAPEARIVLMEGNHDRRLQKSIIRNAQAAFGIQRANLPAEWPVLSVPFLLRLDELGIGYLAGYPANIFWVNDNLACIHGSRVRSSGSTAAAVIDDERVSVVFGHVHRIERQHRTRRTRTGPKTTFAVSPGCLCRTDGTVPGVKGSTDPYGRPVTTAENWQKGLAVVSYEEGNGAFDLEQVAIHDLEDGVFAVFRGERYEASSALQDAA